MTRRNSGPCSIRANFSQASSATTGQLSVAGAAADFDLAPAGLAAQRDEDALVEDLGPAGSVSGLPGAAVEPDDFRAPQPAGEADQQDRAVAQAAEVAKIERRDHRLEVLGQDRFFLLGRPPLGAADAGEDGGDVAVGAVEFFAALREIPPQRRDPPLEGGDRVGFSGRSPRRRRRRHRGPRICGSGGRAGRPWRRAQPE